VQISVSPGVFFRLALPRAEQPFAGDREQGSAGMRRPSSIFCPRRWPKHSGCWRGHLTPPMPFVSFFLFIFFWMLQFFPAFPHGKPGEAAR